MAKKDTRLIERWLPIAEVGIESVRERTPMTPFPAPNRLHVWWARRPLVAARAAILASLLPADADRDRFLHVLGIHGDPVASRRRIDLSRRTGVRFEGEAYSYPRAFSHVPDQADRSFVASELERAGRQHPVVLDPTAGGGSIPLESVRLGFLTVANDLNPVAALIEKATVEYPLIFGRAVFEEFRNIADEFVRLRDIALAPYFPPEPEHNAISTNFLWARTITCPYCDGLVPLSPNWRLAPDGSGVRLMPDPVSGPGSQGRRCAFEIVKSAKEQSPGTIADGDANCPFPDCGRVIDGDEVKRQAQAGRMGEQLYAIVFKRTVETKTKSGKRGRTKWERGYRAPRPEDDNSVLIAARLAEKLPEWEALDMLPPEAISELSNYDRGHRMYGMALWREMFSPRQLLCHGTSVEIFTELLRSREKRATISDVDRAAFVYLAIALDTMLNYGNRSCRWDIVTERVRSIFDRHNFAFCWSYSEMAPVTAGVGYDWTIKKTESCIEELIALLRPDAKYDGTLFAKAAYQSDTPALTISCKSADVLDHLEDASIDVAVMDPPYYDNVMYAELSDFFYVWLKRTAGHVVPELFTRHLTDKDNEAVANPAKFSGERLAKVRAGRDYQQRMQRIFEECRRVLKPNGVLTLMFTHKATGAWDALTTGLMEAGFAMTASWPINTEAEGSMHIKDKSAANSTIFLVCRPRDEEARSSETLYWEDVEPLVARAVRARVEEYQAAGISGVDLYLASFGPALEEFSRHWPLKRGTPRPTPEVVKKRKQKELFPEEWDPYEVTPEDALDAARREVKRWRLERLTHMKANQEIDPLTSWFVLAWDAFKAPTFPYDEALRLARAVGVDLDRQVVGVLAEKNASNLKLWDSSHRAAKGALGPSDGSRAMIDAVHHAAHVGRSRNLQQARELVSKAGLDGEPQFFAALEAVLEVLPVSKTFSGVDLSGDLAEAGSDFEALENLRKLAFADTVDEPNQLELWREPEPG